IDLDKTGELIGFVQTSSEKKRGKLDRGKEYEAPHLAKTSGIKAKLLADNGEYVLGLARDSTTQRRVNDCHRAFVEQVKACLAATQEETLTSIMNFLEQLDISKLSLPKDLEPAHVLTFRVGDTLPIHLKSVQNYWA